MEGENAVEILQRYRRDRHVLLDFILCSNLIKKVVMPPGAVSFDDVDLDEVSVDYVLSCAKKGEILELSEAIRDFHDQTGLPLTKTGSGNDFYLATNPECSGSPPKRAPPRKPISSPLQAASNISKRKSINSTQVHDLTVDDIEDFEDEDDAEEVNNLGMSRRNPNDDADLVLVLPSFTTGITDDDLRETAYEILLACAGASGGLIVPKKEKKKDKKSRLMMKLGRSKSGSTSGKSKRAPSLVGLLETLRVQMEISEAMDIRTRQGLNALAEKVGKRMDTVLIPLELLCCISCTEFSDKKAYIRWQKRQLNMLEEGLINHSAVGFAESGYDSSELRNLLAKIEESESLPPSTGELQRTECLKTLREIAIPLAERPAQGDSTGEVCHWADGYHLNVRLYEKLLLSVFDILDEGKLTQEIAELLELFRSTWRVLGITETIHYTCYAWVLFRQYVITSELQLLQHAIEQLKKVPLKEQRGPHLKSLCSEVGGQEFSFLQSFLSPIQKWADKQLGDYHLHFAEGSLAMKYVVAITMVTRRLLMEENGAATQSTTDTDQDQIELYISSSIRNAFARVLQAVERSDTTDKHPLGLLAEEAKNLIEKDSTIFMPVLSQRHPLALVVSVSLIHKLYGSKLKPFVDDAEHLTEDVLTVIPAADSLEQYIMSLIMSTCEEGTAEVHYKKLTSYQIESISGTMVTRWLNSQQERILEWIERAIQQEEWEPISAQRRHGSSIVEVYRIVEETVDQFFALEVPMRHTELSGLFSGIDNAFQVFANNVTEKLASKDDIIPPVPILTRYSKGVGIKSFMKLDIFDSGQPDDEKSSTEVTVLTTPTLCVQLNTLYYAISQLNKLEENILEKWATKKPRETFIKESMDENSEGLTQDDTFDGTRKDINAAIDCICEFTGTKIIFWDLRVPFIDNLYKPSVSQSRLEALMEPLDVELGQICEIIVDPLRDRVVTSLLQASRDGLLRVLLDGGQYRLFSPADAKLLEEDLEILKEFFFSGGEGLPQEVIEHEVERVKQVIELQSHETPELIERLKSTSSVEAEGGESEEGAESRILLRILCHRTDSEASKFLKKQYKIPKSSAI